MSKVDVTAYISETACTIMIIIYSIISFLGGAYIGYKEAKYEYKVDTISVSSNNSTKFEIKKLDKEKNYE